METGNHSIQKQRVKDLTVEDVAEELSMHPESIRRMLLAGHLPGYKAGGRWRVTRAALDGFKAAGGVRPVGRPSKGEGANE